jgi:hypothetical protein
MTDGHMTGGHMLSDMSLIISTLLASKIFWPARAEAISPGEGVFFRRVAAPV